MARERIPEHTERATTVCKNAKSEARQYEILDSKVPNLQLRVNANGKEWSLRYRAAVGNKWGNKRLPLGDFPTVSVANARAAALQARAYIARGGDPMADREKEAEKRAEEIKAREIAEASRVLLKTEFDEYMSSPKPSNRADKGASIRRMFEKDILPKIGNKEMKEVTQGEIFKILTSILSRGTNRMAQSTLSELKQFFSFSVLRETIKTNPCDAIKKKDVGETKESDSRALDPEEIRKLDQALYASSLNRVTHIVYMLQIAMTCRINELCQASWDQVDWKKREWAIPAPKNKSRREIVIALSPYALGLFKELHSLTGHTKWLYPGKAGERPVNIKQACNHARDRQRPEGADPVKNRTVQTRSLVIGNFVWHTHDLRKSGSTLMQRMGIPTEVSERCLNHTDPNKVKQIYHLWGYDPEMKRAWFLLSEALAVITGERGVEFLDELSADQHREMEDQVGFLGLVKQFYVKPTS